jgi:hypothetical protein
MMPMCVLACLEGRFLPMLDPSNIDPPWISPHLPALPTDKVNSESPPSPIFNPEDLIGRTFLMDEQEDGQKFRGRIVELIEDHESTLEDNPTRFKFRVSVNEDKAEENITYNKRLEYITKDEESDIQWKFDALCLMSTKGHNAIF